MLKMPAVVSSALLIMSCATSNRSGYDYNEVRVTNNARELIRNVTITVSDTGRVFSCGNVAPFGICSNRFGRRSYEMNPIRVEWTFGNSTRQSEEFVVAVPASFTTAFPLRGVLAIAADGSISTYFTQQTPNR